MFYDIKEKRIDEASHTRWWATAAFSAITITVSFVGIIFWLGINAKHESYVERQPVSFREFDFTSPARPQPTALPKIEYPSAEILKTTIKNKKARIEMVESSGEKIQTISSRPTVYITPSSQSIREIEETLPDEVTPITTLASQIPEIRNDLPSTSTKRMVPTLNIDRYVNLQLHEGINPLEETHSFSSGNANGPSSVKKKSEAIPPSWFDPNLQSNSVKPDPANHLKSDSIYDISEFSSIKPDLSTFNMKTIPAFTYLKEPVPEVENLQDDSESAQSSSNGDYSYYYQQVSDKLDQREPLKSENTIYMFLQRRMKDLQDWIRKTNRKNRTSDLTDVLKAVNASFHSKGVGVLLSKFKDFYSTMNSSDFQNMPVANLLYPTSPTVLNNSSSLVSFGLLAIDLFLLHNVQQIVWNEESKIGEEMLKDPDVLALNSLFLSPDRIQQLRATESNSRIFTNKQKGMLHELIEFVNGGLRAALNLSKAYRSSTNSRARSSKESTPIDCIWTLYCRNLDKTAKLHGPYGFLAKMNSLGLRLMMGEFPVNKALEKLMKEYNDGWGTLNCDKLFPRCSADEAKEIVIQTALGRSPV